MALDTEITGDPASVERASTWLRGTLAPGVDGAADALVAARKSADSDWNGDAGPAFSAQMRTASTRTDELTTLVKKSAASCEQYASRLRTAQDRMAAVREAASAAGLAVHGFTIENPGPGPGDPGPPPTGDLVTPHQVDLYNTSVATFNRHQELVRAWNRAVTDAADVRTDYDTACTALEDDYAGMSGTEWVIEAADIAGESAAGIASTYHAKILRQTANSFKLEYERSLQRIHATDYSQTGHKAFYDDVKVADDLKARANSAAGAADDASKLGKFEGAGKNLSRGLVGLGIGIDLYEGESVPQAVASNVGGYVVGTAAGTGASIAASAAMGAAFGSVVPGVGTAVGAVVGLGVGIFASGAIDSLFENGPDVGEAFDSGVEAVTDTVGAVGDAAGAVGDFVGGLF